MSKTATRTTGQKRKHDEISATSPGASSTSATLNMAGMAMNGAQRQWDPSAQYDANGYQNPYYLPQQNGFNGNQQMMYAMQQAQAAMAAAGMPGGSVNQAPSGPSGSGARGGNAAGTSGGMGTPASAGTPGQTGRGTDTVDRSSYNQLKDAMAVGGVSLREEEESLHRARRIPNTYTGHDRTRTQDFVPPEFLVELFRAVAKHHKLKGLTQDVLTLAGLAVQERLRGLVEKANAASVHAWETGAGGQLHATATGDGDTPGEHISMYADGKTPVFDRNLRRDVGMQLLAIEKVEKAEEMRIRKERKERVEQARQTGGGNAANADADEDDDGPPKKKKKRADGPGVQAKNMSEETKKKLSNNVANAAAGFADRYKWMSSGGARPTPRGGAGGNAGNAGGGGGGAGAGNTWGGWGGSGRAGKARGGAKGKDKERTVGMRDVLFVVERERGHGAGRGSARGWS